MQQLDMFKPNPVILTNDQFREALFEQVKRLKGVSVGQAFTSVDMSEGPDKSMRIRGRHADKIIIDEVGYF
jgi:hypothetical protein